MSHKIFVDTLFVVALINPRDVYHTRASQVADLYESSSPITTEAVLLEIGNALARNFKTQAIEVIGDLLSSAEVEIVQLTPQVFDRVYSLYKQFADKKWG